MFVFGFVLYVTRKLSQAQNSYHTLTFTYTTNKHVNISQTLIPIRSQIRTHKTCNLCITETSSMISISRFNLSVFKNPSTDG